MHDGETSRAETDDERPLVETGLVKKQKNMAMKGSTFSTTILFTISTSGPRLSEYLNES